MKQENHIDVVIENLKMRFEATEYNEVIRFIKRDYPIYDNANKEKPNINVEVEFVDFKCPQNTVKLSSNIFLWNNYICMKFEGKLRKVWVLFSVKPLLGSSIRIMIPKIYLVNSIFTKFKENFFRLIFPNHLYRWQNILIDILHGPILGILQIHLLKNDKALLHASSIANSNGDGIVFPGWAQSGKSTIVDRLVKKKSWKFIAEDFCILTSNNKIISFPKQRRIYASQLKETKYKSIPRTFLEKTFDNLNLSIYKLLKSSKSMRILSAEEIFDNEVIIEDANLNAIIFLIRGNYGEINLKGIENETMASMCADMMFFEMQNFNGFYQLLAAYGVVSGCSDLINSITCSLKEQYIKLFKESKCYIMEVPETQELDFIETTLHFKLKDILLSKRGKY